MTTIAYDGRYIAVDSRVSQDSRIANDSCKKYLENDDWIMFICGSLALYDSFFECFVSGIEFNKKGSISAVACRKSDSKVYDVVLNDGQFDLCHLYHQDALGSGASYAISAMEFGNSAVDAVKFAGKKDLYTGGEIRCFDTQTKKFVKVGK